MKKTVIAIVGAVTLGVVIFGTSLYSYLKTAGHMAEESLKDQIPADVQIEHAKRLIKDELQPEIDRLKEQIVRSRHDIQKGEIALQERADKLALDRSEMMARSEQLKSEKGTFVIKDVSYTKEQLTEDLEKRFGYFQTAEETFKQEEKVLDAKKRALAEGEKKVAALMDAKKKLELEIEEIQARMKAVEAEEAVQEIAVDDSKFSEVRDLLDELKTDVEVREQIVGEKNVDSSLIPVETEDSKPSNIVDRVDAYLGVSKDAGTVAESNE